MKKKKRKRKTDDDYLDTPSSLDRLEELKTVDIATNSKKSIQMLNNYIQRVFYEKRKSAESSE